MWEFSSLASLLYLTVSLFDGDECSSEQVWKLKFRPNCRLFARAFKSRKGRVSVSTSLMFAFGRGKGAAFCDNALREILDLRREKRGLETQAQIAINSTTSPR